VHDDPEHDDDLVDLIDDDEQTENASMLSIRNADGEEVVSIFATADEWNVHLQPGGAIRNAFLGSRAESPVWVTSADTEIERDEDGTYVIRLG
jgi:hypothetical protein